MKQIKASRPDVLIGLTTIARYMGKRDYHTIIRWRERLGFPLFLNPSALLAGKHRFYTTVDAIKAWEYALANAVARKQGTEFDRSLPCPLCGLSDAGIQLNTPAKADPHEKTRTGHPEVPVNQNEPSEKNN